MKRIISRLRFGLGLYIPRIYKEKAGVISSDECWVIFHGCWMYTGDTLRQALWQMIRDYRSDRHLVG